MIKRIVVGPIQENCYIVSSGSSCVVIDPGDESKRIIEEIAQLDVKGILITHGHYDHIGAVNELRDYYHTNVYATEDAKDMMLDWDENLSVMLGGEKYIVDDVIAIEDSITLGEMYFGIYKTPGHAKGSCLYYYAKEDALFKGGCGRVDFPTGDKFSLLKSLSRIKNLDLDAYVYPGHGPESTLSFEKKNNPFLSF